MTSTSDALVIGAGPAGLSCAVTLRAAGLDVTVLEKSDSVGAVWRRHYDRLRQITVPTGQLREIAIEAELIADHAKSCVRTTFR